MRFQVLYGIHVANGRIYEKGQFIDSDQDLTRTFVNKFARVDAVPGDAVAMGGAGEAEESSPPSPSPAPSPPAEQIAQQEGEQQGSEGRQPRGLDVTKQFPKAMDEDYKVFRRRGEYFVYDSDDLSKPINEKGVDKASVSGVIEASLKA